MIKIGNKIELNLQEAVLKNKDDISDLKSINGLLGIKIVGSVTEPGDLPEYTSEEFINLEYGDAYILVEDEESGKYKFYVKTRPNTDQDYDHWFELNLQGIEGPRGIQGPAGPTGVRGSRMWIGSPDYNEVMEGDCVLDSDTGAVYELINVEGDWRRSDTPSANIRGPRGVQGIQGPTGPEGPRGEKGDRGPQGDPGGFISIQGHLDSVAALPTPPANPTDAYLVGNDDTLYIWLGDQVKWQSIGTLNVATYVTVNGTYVGTYEMNQKLDKVSNSGSRRAYTIETNGTQSTTTVEKDPVKNSIVQRDGSGHIKAARANAQNDVVILSQLQDQLGDYEFNAYVLDGEFSVAVVDENAFWDAYGKLSYIVFTYSETDEAWTDSNGGFGIYPEDIGIVITGPVFDEQQFEVESYYHGGVIPDIHLSDVGRYLKVTSDGLEWQPAGGGAPKYMHYVTASVSYSSTSAVFQFPIISTRATKAVYAADVANMLTEGGFTSSNDKFIAGTQYSGSSAYRSQIWVENGSVKANFSGGTGTIRFTFTSDYVVAL